MCTREIVDLGVRFVVIGLCIAFGSLLPCALRVAMGASIVVSNDTLYIMIGAGCMMTVGVITVCVGVIKR
jgi:hypothetical protein